MGPQWLRDYYDDVDNMRLEPYLAHHTDDVKVTFGNNPTAVGKVLHLHSERASAPR